VYLQRTPKPSFGEPAMGQRDQRSLNRELDQVLDPAP
jgi:hypothetical protein